MARVSRLLAASIGFALCLVSGLACALAPYSLRPEHVAVVINADDANSVAVGEYYQRARKIPARNVVRVHLPGSPHRLSLAEFTPLRAEILGRLDSRVQVIVLAWTAPYAVECNSITSALTLGFEPGQCQNTCAPGRMSPYYDSPSVRPFTDFGIRLAMLLPTQSVADAKALIERGMLSNFRRPSGTAYFLSTSDPYRNTRAAFFPPVGLISRPGLTIKTLRADSIADVKDIMFYLTGAASVPKLETLRFLPGALADHLTSAGGDLLESSQMSALRWLEAGATATYGTVSEPCNHWQKFPNPAVLLKHYVSGASAVEAYWKSVAWPAQGVFVGEPLASPYRR